MHGTNITQPSGIGLVLSPEWGRRPQPLVPSVVTERVRRVDPLSRRRLRYVLGSASGRRVAR